jgi:hypothetical protein
MSHSVQKITRLRALEGRQVSLALTDGSRIDDAQLISAGRHGLRTIWVFTNGVDAFLPLVDVVDIWESVAGTRGRRAA